MAKTQAAKYQAAYRERKRAAVLFDDLPQRIQDKLIAGQRWKVRETPGSYFVDWQMTKPVEEFIEGYAKGQGLTFDELMELVSVEILRRFLARAEAQIRRN